MTGVWPTLRARMQIVEVTGQASRTCIGCGVDKPLSEFSQHEWRCRPCANRRKRAWERATADPESVEGVNRMVNLAPDRLPAVRLREQLQARKARGEPFGTAWPAALHAVVSCVPKREKQDWLAALKWSRQFWLAAYHPSVAVKLPALFVPGEVAA